jgi:hypothetical protein
MGWVKRLTAIALVFTVFTGASPIKPSQPIVTGCVIINGNSPDDDCIWN